MDILDVDILDVDNLENNEPLMKRANHQHGSAEKSKFGKRNTQDHEGQKDELPTRQC